MKLVCIESGFLTDGMRKIRHGQGVSIATYMPCFGAPGVIVAMKVCCLCKNPVHDDPRKRKRLHGPGCKAAKDVLQDLAGVSLEVFVRIRDTEAVLCTTCELNLNNVKKLADKLLERRND